MLSILEKWIPTRRMKKLSQDFLRVEFRIRRVFDSHSYWLLSKSNESRHKARV